MSQPGEVRRIFSKGKCPAETGTEDFRLVLHNRMFKSQFQNQERGA